MKPTKLSGYGRYLYVSVLHLPLENGQKKLTKMGWWGDC